jgi:hypothetical protein
MRPSPARRSGQVAIKAGEGNSNSRCAIDQDSEVVRIRSSARGSRREWSGLFELEGLGNGLSRYHRRNAPPIEPESRGEAAKFRGYLAVSVWCFGLDGLLPGQGLGPSCNWPDLPYIPASSR